MTMVENSNPIIHTKHDLPKKIVLNNYTKVTLDVQLMIFFNLNKNALFSRYLDFCVFVKSKNFKIDDVIKDIAT